MELCEQNCKTGNGYSYRQPQSCYLVPDQGELLMNTQSFPAFVPGHWVEEILSTIFY